MGIYWWRGRATWKQLQVVKTNFNGFVSYIFVGKSALSSRSVWCVCLWRKRMFSKTQSCGHANRIVPFEFVQRCQPLSGEHCRKWSWSYCDWNQLIWIKKLADLRVSNMLPFMNTGNAKELVCMVIERWKTVISICIFSTLFSIYMHLWWMRGICLTIFTYFCWWLSPLLSWRILVLLIGLLVHCP